MIATATPIASSAVAISSPKPGLHLRVAAASYRKKSDQEEKARARLKHQQGPPRLLRRKCQRTPSRSVDTQYARSLVAGFGCVDARIGERCRAAVTQAWSEWNRRTGFHLRKRRQNYEVAVSSGGLWRRRYHLVETRVWNLARPVRECLRVRLVGGGRDDSQQRRRQGSQLKKNVAGERDYRQREF